MYPSSFSVQIEVQSSKIDEFLTPIIAKIRFPITQLTGKSYWIQNFFFEKKSNQPSVYIIKYQRVHDPALIESRIKFFRGCQYVDGNAVA